MRVHRGGVVQAVSLDDPLAVSYLLGLLGKTGATGQITALADRAAAHASLDNPAAVAKLLNALRRAGATGQVRALANRATAHASLENPRGLNTRGVADLLGALQEAGEPVHTADLIERLPAAGMFELFRKQEGRGETFQFGREADGRPAKRWAWTDLG
jgi:hypothetical protein